MMAPQVQGENAGRGPGQDRGVDLAASDDLAASVLDMIRAAGATAEAEVLVDAHELALTRFANSAIHQNVAAAHTTVRLRVHAGGRTASGSTTVTSPDGLRDLVERTLAASRLCPPDPQWPGLAPSAAVASVQPIDEETAHAEPSIRAERVRSFIKAADGLVTAGYCSTMWSAMTFMNSAGQTARAETTEAAMDAIARAGTADGVARLCAPRVADIDGALLGARAAAKARAGVDPIELAPGRYEVVLEPTAVFDLLERMSIHAFDGKAINERRSFVELGTAQLDPTVSIVDDPLDSGGAGLPFDSEGTPRGRLVLVDGGLMAGAAHSRRSAASAGAQSTGHAVLGTAPAGGIPRNLQLLPGPNGPNGARGGASAPFAPHEVDGPAADSSVADLVAQVGHGLLVTDNWYTRVLDPRTLVITGLTRNGVWLIEDGVITKPVQNLRFTQSYPDALAPGAVLAIGAHAASLSGSWEIMTFRVPALRLASWNYTGNASG